jgi:hypothetical protein
MEAEGSFETLVEIYQTPKRYQIPEDNLHTGVRTSYLAKRRLYDLDNLN